MPKHVAIIMDGNGRWAQKRKLPRVMGHLQGAKTADRITEHARQMGIQTITLYTFSEENWNRPSFETRFLMKLLKRYLTAKKESFIKKNVRAHAIGNLQKLPEDVRAILTDIIQATTTHTQINVVLALSYSSRDEIVSAVQAVVQDVQDKKLTPNQITPDCFASHLSTHPFGDPELIIRTSGEKRLSNFLLWQAAYSEFYFSDILWPDFTTDDFSNAIADYQKRDRRFGNVPSDTVNEAVTVTDTEIDSAFSIDENA